MAAKVHHVGDLGEIYDVRRGRLIPVSSQEIRSRLQGARYLPSLQTRETKTTDEIKEAMREMAAYYRRLGVPVIPLTEPTKRRMSNGEHHRE